MNIKVLKSNYTKTGKNDDFLEIYAFRPRSPSDNPQLIKEALSDGAEGIKELAMDVKLDCPI